MALPTLSFALGLVVTLYLSTFVLFALLRIITGISIQRVGYSGFRRIAFSPRDGISIRVRGIGLSVHRPTFAQPTWVSLNLTELELVVDLKALSHSQKSSKTETANGHAGDDRVVEDNGKNGDLPAVGTQGRTWRKLTAIKEQVKLLHRSIRWMRLVDVIALGTQLVIEDVGTVRIERFSLAVDTRIKTVDRSRLFQHSKTRSERSSPAEWKCLIRDILFTAEGKESTEVIDYATISAHGFLHKDLDGLRDASIAVKLGRLTIPYDDIDNAAEHARQFQSHAGAVSPSDKPKVSLNDVAGELDDTGSRDEMIVQTVADSREFVSSILRGIQEIQIAVGFLGLSKQIQAVSSTGRRIYANLAMKEVGLDLLRLDSRSPAHRMYFSTKDVAHQALLTAISISAGVDDGHEHPERMIYVPMVTATVKTTLPSKTVQYSTNADIHDRNTNILFANLVCTSPSVDLDPKHLPLVLAILRSRHATSRSSEMPRIRQRHSLISRLLPKASIKFAMTEPVVRVSLPPLDPSRATLDGHNEKEHKYDMIISSTSSITLDVESQHASDSQDHYGTTINYRQTSHHLYGQTFVGERHDLFFSDTIEVKVDINAMPEVSVDVGGKCQTLSLSLVRPDICEGIRQIVLALRRDPLLAKTSSGVSQPSFLRRMPAWLQHVHLKGSDFNVEMSGHDTAISKYSRGFALQLESCSTEYKAHRGDEYEAPLQRRSLSKSRLRGKTSRSQSPSSPDKMRKKPASEEDGRRLTLHVQGLDGFIIDSRPDSKAESFLRLPRFEVAFTTSTDQHGPIFHINSHAKSLLVHYSLYNHFAVGVAFLILRKTFTVPVSETDAHGVTENNVSSASLGIPGTTETSQTKHVTDKEIMTLDFKASLIQVKADTPSDPPLMVQIYGLEAGRHRWAAPFLRSKLVRVYAGTPQMRSVWSRVLSIKALKVDLRDMKRKVGKHTVDQKSIDVATDAIRVAVPHQLIVHNIFDNITNIVKATTQLHHHFTTGSDEYVLAKHPEGPKRVPKVTLRSQVLIFELEDSAFEWKLGTIYRAGLQEQKQRLARAEAFRLKAKKLDARNQKGSSRPRAHSARPDKSRPDKRKQSPNSATGRRRSRGDPPNGHDEETEDRGRRHGRLRYNADGQCDLTNTCTRTVDQAKAELDHFNAQSWKKRIDRAMYQQTHTMRDLRNLFWGLDEIPEEMEQTEPIMAMAQRPALMAALISDLSISVDKPSFPLNELAGFMHDVGKGMPLDMKYGLLVPMSLHVNMGEARVSLRDYPLPLMHVPPIRPGQSPKLPSLSLSTDFVIGEEFRDIQSQRHVTVVVVPADKLGPDDRAKKFAIDVRRTISPVKTYSNMKIDINTSSPTRITWGSSFQPAIQDMMQVIEGFTKPPMDPSDRVGFWDKIRLSFHSRIQVSWKGDGDVHLNFKGSRDPYVVTGYGAGFVMVWRNNVCWRIAQDSDPRKFMTVNSGDYILAVPDFNHYARSFSEHEEPNDTVSESTNSAKSTAMFKKVVMKLSGNVQWLAGLVFEQGLKGDQRRFGFKPHYEVVLKHPDYAKAPIGENYDAFDGFRSQHIHMSVAVAAPLSRDWNVSNLKPSNNYNSVHLTPRFFTHFYNWWSLFSGVMSLPVRQGPLWGGQEKSSKKFGRHLATIKYNLLLSPVFISHIYKHKDAEDYQSDVVSATGLKMKFDSLMLDLHQRRETFEIPGHEDAKPKTTSGMKINQSQLDFISGDIRAVSASIRGTSSKELDNADVDELAAYSSVARTKIDMSKFTIPDNDFSWIDMDDFVELDWVLPSKSNPETKILPLATAPRFSYFRQTDHGDSVSGDTTRSSVFGEESTHFCVMSAKNDPRRVQADLIQQRIDKIKEQIRNNDGAAAEQEVKVVREVTGDTSCAERLHALKNHSHTLQKKHDLLSRMLKELIQRFEDDDPAAVPDLETTDETYDGHHREGDAEGNHVFESAPLADYTSDFNNRFVVHNAQLKWNNSLRNIILRYIHQVSQRRGFVYYMSRRAVKFILDILEERQKPASASVHTPNRRPSVYSEGLSPGREDDVTIQDRIDELLRDGRSFVNADDPEKDETQGKTGGNDGGEEISTEFTANNTYHFRLIAPQIQLQSERDTKSVVLVTAKGMQLKVVSIMDKNREQEEISGLVQRRFSAAMDSLQMFVTSTKTFSTEYLHMYSANRYGARAGTYWPPWVPLEVMFEFANNPYGFSRVVHRTSASLRYDKYNTLRLKYNDNVSGQQDSTRQSPDSAENRMDHCWVEFPHFRAICDSAQYYAMYIIVMDLLLYSEPLEKTRSERLEKIMLASDFSDLTGAPEMVQMLQHRIHQLEEIKMHFRVNEKFLDRQGWRDRISMDQDLAGCEDELFFMMKAITTSQRRIEDRGPQDASNGVLRTLISAKEIAWHLIREKSESLMEFQLKNASFDRTDNNDGSNVNCVAIGRINGFNLLPNALYPQIIAPYVDEARGFHELADVQMLRVHWLMLEAIAGIPVVDYFEVDLVPVQVQLEREVAKRLFEYIFPGVGGNAFEGSGFSPMAVKKSMLPTQQEEDEDDKGKDEDAATPKLDSSESTQDAEQGHDHGEGAGALEHRLQPTLGLSDPRDNGKHKKHGLGISGTGHGSSTNGHHWSLFQHSNRSASSIERKGSKKVPSRSNLSIMSRSTSDQAVNGSDVASTTGDSAKGKRVTSSDKKKDKHTDKDKEASDDLTQMMNRASNYMTVSYLKVHGMVLCLSYKGRGARNIEDVQDLVIRLPTLEYRNKTWSNLDLALQLKKDVIKALISHAGAIVGNKFAHHRPSRQQQTRLRELASTSTLMSVHDNGSATPTSDDGSSFLVDDGPGNADEALRTSFTSGRPRSLTRFETGVSGASAAEEQSGGHEAAPSRSSHDFEQSSARNRASSIGKHFSGLGHRLRQSTDGAGDDTEESTRRKSRLLLGGQKLLRSIPHP